MFEGNFLVIDDEEVICNLIRDTLTEKGYSVVFVSDAKKGVELVQYNKFDVVFLDLRMPEMDGIAVLKKLKEYGPDNVVVIITGYPSFETIRESMHEGAFDYLVKPFDLEELVFTAKGALAFSRLNQENKKLLQQITQQNIVLEKKVSERTKDINNLYWELKTAYMTTIKALAKILDARDSRIHSHSDNVVNYALKIAEGMELPDKEVNDIRDACGLYNLVKLSAHDDLLNKPEKLSDKDWEEIKSHSQKSVEVLKHSIFLDNIIYFIRQHHEHYDGNGYPNGLKAEQIKLGARIIAVADAFDAMLSERDYRKKVLSKEQAIEEIKKGSGTKFDPKVIEAFLRIVDKI